MSRSLSKKIRFEVFKRDNFVCQYCGNHPPDVILEVDHVISIKQGGTSDESNLVTACFNCNRGKAANSLSSSSVPKGLADKSAEIREREAQIAGYREIMLQRMERIECYKWAVAEALEPGCSAPEIGFRKDWLATVKRFNDQLPLDVVIDAAEIAYARWPFSLGNRFRYFCGICWNKIRPERSAATQAEQLRTYCRPQMMNISPDDCEVVDATHSDY